MSNLTIYWIVVSCLWAASAAGIAWYCATVAQQITYVTLADGRRRQRRLPLMFRLLLPLTQNVAWLFRRPSFEKARTNADRQIVSAGFEDLLNGVELMSLRILAPLIFGSFWVLFILLCASASTGSPLQSSRGFLCAMGPLLLFVYPSSWLRRAVATRHTSIRRSLPFVLDLLTLSVESGMDFMMALQRNVEKSKVDELNEELIRVVREIQLGRTRREALLDMSERINLPDIRSVVSALVQADELGVGIGSILRIQSDQIRQRRFERAEKLANEAPVKMLAPLMLFIFPAVFLILLAPIITQLARQGF